MSCYQRILFTLLAILPFLNIYPYAPYGAWTVETIALILAALIISSSNKTTEITVTTKINTTQIVLVGLIIASAASYIINRPSYVSITAITIFFLACGFLLSQKIATLPNHQDDIVHSLANGLLIGTLIQILIAASQISGLFNTYAISVDGLPLIIPQPSLTDTPYGLIFQRNLFADYIFMGGLASCYLYSKNKIGPKTLCAVLIITSLFASFSMSRSVIAYALASLILLPIMHYKACNSKKITFSVLAYIITILFFQIATPNIPSEISAYFPFLSEGSGLTRLQAGMDDIRKTEWLKSWHSFTQNPWFGSGIGTNSASSMQYKSIYQYKNYSTITPANFTHSHNIFIQLLSETGIVGGLVAILGSIYIIIQVFKKDFNTEKIFITLCISTLFIHSQFEYPLWYASYFILFVCLISLIDISSYNFKIKKPNPKFITFTILPICAFGVITNIQLISLSRVPENQTAQQQALNKAISLSNIFFVADIADDYILRHLKLNKQNIEYKIYLSEKQLHFRPSPTTLFRYAIYLSYANRYSESVEAMDTLLTLHPSLINHFSIEFIEIQNEPEMKKLKPIILKNMQKLQSTES